jgi:hypothetical protein
MFNAGRDGNFYVYLHPPEFYFPYTAFETASLHLRDLVMEERLLFLRTLNFGATVVWECCRTLLNEYHLEEKHGNASDDFTVKGHFQNFQPFQTLIRTKVSRQRTRTVAS